MRLPITIPTTQTLPPPFINNMQSLLLEDYPAYANSLEEPAAAGLRVNTLKTTRPKLENLLGTPLQPVPWCKEGFYDNGIPFSLSKSPLYHAGLYYLQEPSAMCPAAVLNPQPGERVLDLCAAPGGKTTQLAAAMEGKGFLLANDPSHGRCKGLLKNLNLFGVTNSLVTCEEPHRLANVFPAFFNKILVDAPCSGEGMFRKEPAVAKDWTSPENSRFPALQQEILCKACDVLAPGGRMVYSTCTFNRYENEHIIQQVLLKHQDIFILPLNHESLGIDHALPLPGDEDVAGCGRIWPHKQRGEGHFIALLGKKGDCPPQPVLGKMPSAAPKRDIEAFHNFCGELGVTFIHADDRFMVKHGQSLFFHPQDCPAEAIAGLRLVSSGFYVGDVKDGRFSPSQALALGLRSEDVEGCLHLSLADERVERYLRGESFEADGPQGWRLVCVEGYPLGFGKMSQGRLKNKYQRSWLT